MPLFVNKKASKSNSYKQASAMLIEVENDVTKAILEYFEGFLTLFQNFGPTFHSHTYGDKIIPEEDT